MFGLILLYRLLFDIISFDVAAVLFVFSFIADDEEKSAIDPIRDTKMCRDAARALFYLALGPDKTSSSSYQTPDFVLMVLFTTTFIPQPPPPRFYYLFPTRSLPSFSFRGSVINLMVQ